MACHLHPIICTWEAVTSCTPVTIFFPLRLCSKKKKLTSLENLPVFSSVHVIRRDPNAATTTVHDQNGHKKVPRLEVGHVFCARDYALTIYAYTIQGTCRHVVTTISVLCMTFQGGCKLQEPLYFRA